VRLLWNTPLGREVGTHGGQDGQRRTQAALTLSNDDIEALWLSKPWDDP